MIEVILKRFEHPDDVRHFEKGTFETVTLGGMTIGRATCQPGWKGSGTWAPVSVSSTARWSTSAW